MTSPFKLLLADPPWSFNDKGSRMAPDSGKAARGYDTMSLEDICTLPVRYIVAEDAALFLWSTWSHLLDGSAAAVVNAWGFRPVVVIPWIKVSWVAGEGRFPEAASHPALSRLYRVGFRLQIGGGHYVRNMSEPLILCRLKHTPVVDPALRLAGLIAAPRPSGHSSKPRASYAMIEHLYPEHTPRLELFARGPVRPGWWGWGDQATGPHVLASLADPKSGVDVDP